MEQILPRTLSRKRQTHCEVGAQSRGSGHTPDSRAAEGGATHNSTGTSWSSARNTRGPLCSQEIARLPVVSFCPVLSLPSYFAFPFSPRLNEARLSNLNRGSQHRTRPRPALTP